MKLTQERISLALVSITLGALLWQGSWPVAIALVALVALAGLGRVVDARRTDRDELLRRVTASEEREVVVRGQLVRLANKLGIAL